MYWWQSYFVRLTYFYFSLFFITTVRLFDSWFDGSVTQSWNIFRNLFYYIDFSRLFPRNVFKVEISSGNGQGFKLKYSKINKALIDMEMCCRYRNSINLASYWISSLKPYFIWYTMVLFCWYSKTFILILCGNRYYHCSIIHNRDLFRNFLYFICWK